LSQVDITLDCLDLSPAKVLTGKRGFGGIDEENNMNRRIDCPRIMGILLMAALLVAGTGGLARADDSTDTRHLVEKSRMTLDSFDSAKEMSAFRDLLKDAKGVFIAPQILKGAFIVGASGGSGVFMVRDARTGKWSQPAFYTIGSGSFGLQIGGQASEVVLLAMTDRGVNAMLSSSVKLGADVGIAVGPVGMGASAATANVSADILSFARSKGLFAGISLDGAVVKVRNGWNHAYYSAQVTPTDILVKRTVANHQSGPLISAISKDARKG
jgi:lipid-binding SYLF domain-containing protein